MAVTTHNAPFTHASLEGALSAGWVDLSMLLTQVLHETWSPLMSGLLEYYGDPTGTNSDTVRRFNVSGFGAQVAFTAAASETTVANPVDIDTDFDDLTVAEHIIAYSQTQLSRILNGRGQLNVEELANTLIGSVFATARSLTATRVAAFGNNAADAAATLDVDDMFAARAVFEETAGFRGVANGMFKGQQLTHLRGSMRNETALQFPDQFAQDQNLQRGEGPAFSFLGMRLYRSSSVDTSGGTHSGGLWVPGKLGFVKASPSAANIPASAEPQYQDDIGLAAWRSFGDDNRVHRVDAALYMGVGVIADKVYGPGIAMESLAP